jgi:hypothetical protein
LSTVAFAVRLTVGCSGGEVDRFRHECEIIIAADQRRRDEEIRANFARANERQRARVHQAAAVALLPNQQQVCVRAHTGTTAGGRCRRPCTPRGPKLHSNEWRYSYRVKFIVLLGTTRHHGSLLVMGLIVGFWVLGFGLFFMIYFGLGFWRFTQNFGTQNIFENDEYFDQKLYISKDKNIF